MSTNDASLPAVIDAAHLAHQHEFSLATFGPGPRTKGVLDHIRKELAEIEADPDDLVEWVDVLILAFDGAWRAGWEPQQIIDAIKAKQARNEARTWPDWRTADRDQAIEHVRPLAANLCPVGRFTYPCTRREAHEGPHRDRDGVTWRWGYPHPALTDPALTGPYVTSRNDEQQD